MTNHTDFSGLSAVFFNGTLKKSPETSNTEGLLRASMELMKKPGAYKTMMEQHKIVIEEY